MTVTIDERNAMTAREYAHSLGLAKLGRGKLSQDARDAIAKAESEGVTFQPSASDVAKAEAEARKAEGRTRKPKATTPNNTPNSVIVGGKFTDKVVKSDYDGASLHPSVEWFRKTFYVGAYVSTPTGQTLFCISNEPDSEGWCRFVDKAGKVWKYRVNAMWGVRKGWTTGGESTENAA